MGAALIPLYCPPSSASPPGQKIWESCRDMIRAALGRMSVAELLLLITHARSRRTPQVSPSRAPWEQRSPCKEHARRALSGCEGPQPSSAALPCAPRPGCAGSSLPPTTQPPPLGPVTRGTFLTGKHMFLLSFCLQIAASLLLKDSQKSDHDLA